VLEHGDAEEEFDATALERQVLGVRRERRLPQARDERLDRQVASDVSGMDVLERPAARTELENERVLRNAG
jgi:hypothetical protein